MLLFLFAFNTVFASQEMSAEKWHQLSSGKDYSYKKEIEISEVSIDNPKENFISSLLDFVIQFFASPKGKFLVASIILLVMVYAVVKIILNERTRLKNKKPLKKEEEQETEIILPEDLLQNNWEGLLHDANGNARLTIRYSYMYLLQLLQKNQIINYRTSKTNYDYYFEIKHPELKQNFKRLSRQYEWVWYGNYELTPDKLEQFTTTFQQSIKYLKK